jgi:hypothetical protein
VLAPKPASLRAIAAPIPLPARVINAIFPVNELFILPSSFVHAVSSSLAILETLSNGTIFLVAVSKRRSRPAFAGHDVRSSLNKNAAKYQLDNS